MVAESPTSWSQILQSSSKPAPGETWPYITALRKPRTSKPPSGGSRRPEPSPLDADTERAHVPSPLENWLTEPDGLATRLRAMRAQAGLSGKDLAASRGWQQSKV